jgi:hypothetical protein
MAAHASQRRAGDSIFRQASRVVALRDQIGHGQQSPLIG